MDVRRSEVRLEGLILRLSGLLKQETYDVFGPVVSGAVLPVGTASRPMRGRGGRDVCWLVDSEGRAVWQRRCWGNKLSFIHSFIHSQETSSNQWSTE